VNPPHRIYAARYVTPIMYDIISKLAIDRPSDINAYVIQVLTDHIRTAATSKKDIALDTKPTGAGEMVVNDEDDPVIVALSAEFARRSPPPPKVHLKLISIVVLGMDGAGKSTILATLQGDPDPRPPPTTGFRPVQMALHDGVRVKFYDLGGGEKIRGIWENYFHDVHGVVYVLDSVKDERAPRRWDEAMALLKKTQEHKFLKGKPLLLLATKQDCPGARIPDWIRQEAELHVNDDTVMIQGCIASAARNKGDVDTRIEYGLGWLFDSVKNRARDLSQRVKNDIAAVDLQLEKAEAERKKMVLKDLIRKSFNSKDREDCFTREQVCKERWKNASPSFLLLLVGLRLF